jgi:hypothetical protein
MLNLLKEKFTELAQERSATPEVISFMTIRRTVGWLGISLPLVLLGSYLIGSCDALQPSISHFYYTNMREIFVGTLCAVSLFLFTYKGHSKLDSQTANLAGLFSLGVALFPTNFLPGFPCQENVASFINVGFHTAIHFSCAALFFLTLAYMSIVLFTKSNLPERDRTPQKRKRNAVYKVCGWIMVGCIACIGIYSFFLQGKTETQIVFWFETIALISFGISWLTKGEALFGDPAKY